MSDSSKMSETPVNENNNSSYEDLVKKIKPCSVVFERLSPEKVSTLKVVDDPARINDETPVIITLDISDDEIEEEVEIDLSEAEANALKELNESRVITCFFCKKNSFSGSLECENHFKLHIDYFPIQCSLCDEANIDVLSFVKHCRKSHPELTKAKYIHKVNSNCSNWLNSFLAEGPSSEFNDKPQQYCPACNWIGLNSTDPNATESAKPGKPLQIVRHINEHIRYKPFSCIKCREIGEDFRVFELDYQDASIRNHIQTKHPDLSPPFWRHFSKKYSIPSLDKFIANYLNIFGVNMPKHRKARKKVPKLDPNLATTVAQTVIQPIGSIPMTNTILNNTLAMTNGPQVITLKMSPQMIAPQIQSSIPTSIAIALKNNSIQLNGQNLLRNITIPNQTITVNGGVFAPGNTNYLQMPSPLLMQPSNDKLNKQNFIIDAADLNIVHIDPSVYEIDDRSFKHICVFCEEPKEFNSAIDMCIHYGIHFNYYPVVCMLCDKRFQDLSTLCEHYNRDHKEYKSNIFHYLKEDEKLEKWIKDFADFQKTHFFNGHVSARFGDYCFVCEKLAKCDDNTMRLKINKVNINAIRDHINQHLNYYPYVCSICFHGNRDVKFTSFNPSAIQHMWRFHVDDKNIPHSALAKLLIKSNENLDLEKFIDEKLFPKRDKTANTTLVLNLKRKLQEIEADTKKRLDTRLSSSSQLPSLPSAQVHPIVRSDNKELVQQQGRQNTHEIHHLTPHMKTYSSPQKTNGVNTFRTQTLQSLLSSSPRPIEYIPTKQTFIEPYLLCFHCHEKVANTSELQIHHQSKHPKLTIASYAPTRRDLNVNY